MKAKHSASLSDEIAVFQAYNDLINSERETIWASLNALLLANSPLLSRYSTSGPRWLSIQRYVKRRRDLAHCRG